MKRILDQETKTFWYYSESGFPTYLAIESYRKQSPSYTHSKANKNTWEELTKKIKKNMDWEIQKISNFNYVKKNNNLNYLLS